MLDFYKVSERQVKRGVTEVYPKFVIGKTGTLLIRGGDFYAVWDEDRGLWSTDENDLIRMIDGDLYSYAEELRKRRPDETIKVMPMWDNDSRSMTSFRTYSQKNMRDNAEDHPLDERLIFSDAVTKKEDYASRKLSYCLDDSEPRAWNELVGVLYSPEERHKIEWAIGSVVNGDSRHLQKFLVLYGAGGTGKTTILDIIELLFEGYVSSFSSKALGTSSNSFPLESLRGNPLVAIDNEGDLSKIEDNTLWNSLVAHDRMTVNEKFKKAYQHTFRCFIFIATNKPVRITDAKSGLIRRLIDVTPTGDKVPAARYKELKKHIPFELGAIARQCRDVYEKDPAYYDNYIPVGMMSATNDFYLFIQDSYYDFRKGDGITLKDAWELYKAYCEDAKVAYPMSRRIFQEELKNYFKEFYDRYTDENGKRVRNMYRIFDASKFERPEKDKPKEEPAGSWLTLDSTMSLLDTAYSSCPAQYAGDEGTPMNKWANVSTVLSDIDTKKLHFVKVPDESHIFIDFDIPGADGKKDREANLREAAKFPPTYAEYSKSGAGVHLHYIYKGDADKLSRIYAPHIEVKVMKGNSSLRRQLSYCNNVPIREISGGLPLKEDIRTIDTKAVQNEKHLRCLILKALNKEGCGGTKPAIDFIGKLLEEAYLGGIYYDVSDLQHDIMLFAMQSTHHSDYCIKKALEFKLEHASSPKCGEYPEEAPIAFFDIEVYPNFFLVCWKVMGEDNVHRMYDPTPQEIAHLITEYRLVGYNCRRYDNHILYARKMGETNEQLYSRSQRIINKDRTAFFGGAYNLSYTDVYDFSDIKQSLKKFEIDLHIHHKEMGIPWDQPVPEELKDAVAEYCENDVVATEAVFKHLASAWDARGILADMSGLTVNDTTNSHTTRIIVGDEKNPQRYFLWRPLSVPVDPQMYEEREKIANGRME